MFDSLFMCCIIVLSETVYDVLTYCRLFQSMLIILLVLHVLCVLCRCSRLADALNESTLRSTVIFVLKCAVFLLPMFQLSCIVLLIASIIMSVWTLPSFVGAEFTF